MGWRLEIVHRSVYRYADEVQASYNEARVTPVAGLRQAPIEHRVEAEPSAHFFRYWDHWGTLVHAFDVHRPHRELVVTGSSVIETMPPTQAVVPLPSWDDLSTPSVTDGLCEYLAPSRFVGLDEPIRKAAADLRAATPADTVRDVVHWIHDRMRYEQGTTTVSTTATESLEAGRGVCQDFAHLALALLRALGVPARYASGYLYPGADAPIGETRTGESHAWFEAWLDGWRAFDPTNASTVAERHVPVGFGRDYNDVPPLKGVIHGGPAESITVTVEATRLA